MANISVYTDRKTGEKYPVGGCIITDDSSNLLLFGASPCARQRLPTKVDLRGNMTSVVHQFRTNACSANAVAGAYEFLIKKKTGKNINVSRLFIYYNGRLKDGRISKKMVDIGSSIGGTIAGMKQYGCCKEDIWKYYPTSINLQPSPKSYSSAKRYHVKNAIHIPTNLIEMKSCLADGYPFIFGLHLFDSFRRTDWNKGRVAMPRPFEASLARHSWHAMVAVGYSDRSKCFFVKNSWGDKWGDKGYCYIPYAYMSNPNHCKDIHVIKSISFKSSQPIKCGASNHEHSKSKVSKPPINPKCSDSDSDQPEFFHDEEFLKLDDSDDSDLEFELIADSDDSHNHNESESLDDTYNHYLGCESTTDPDVSVFNNKCDVENPFTSFILWIGKEIDLTKSIETELMITDKTKINFCQTFAQGIDYLFQNDVWIRSSICQIICRSYFHDEDKNALDLLDILIDLQLDYLPILILTKNKAGVEFHMNKQAPTMYLDNWKEHVFITDQKDELLKKIKENIKNKKESKIF